MPHLTDSAIKKLPVPAKGKKISYDATVPGFGVSVFASGVKSFLLSYSTKAGRERRITLGRFGDWTTVAARSKARELRREIDNGGDPLGDIEDARAAPSMGELLDRFLEEHV